LPHQSDGKQLGKPFIVLQSVDSTNNYAMARIHDGVAQHGMTWFAHSQTAGKGQRDKYWISENGANIIMSVVISPAPLKPTQIFQLSACITVAVFEFLKKFAGNETRIKWPNDIYWRDRKAAGILIENSVLGGNVQNKKDSFGKWKWSIAGIGININQTEFPADIPNPVSLKQITGKNYDTVVMAKQLCEFIDAYFKKLIKEGFQNILESYNNNLYKKNEIVRLKKDNRVFRATIKKVSATGQLLVDHGIEEHLDFGKVQWE
jgi:BirA family transcriptional regulator, biotin operon repressor / biotin---[acetyl-CoA-carboxylase] ligase